MLNEALKKQHLMIHNLYNVAKNVQKVLLKNYQFAVHRFEGQLIMHHIRKLQTFIMKRASFFLLNKKAKKIQSFELDKFNFQL